MMARRWVLSGAAVLVWEMSRPSQVGQEKQNKSKGRDAGEEAIPELHRPLTPSSALTISLRALDLISRLRLRVSSKTEQGPPQTCRSRFTKLASHINTSLMGADSTSQQPGIWPEANHP